MTIQISTLSSDHGNLGRVTWSNGIDERVNGDPMFLGFVQSSFKRYRCGDFGVIGGSADGPGHGEASRGVYRFDDETTVLIATDATRSNTTVRLMDEC